jgi:hypothetical protein
MNMHNPNSQFSTSDVYLAASLNALGHPVITIDRNNPERCKFIFRSSNELREDTDAFWQKTLVVEPQTLFSSLRSLKWQLHAS